MNISELYINFLIESQDEKIKNNIERIPPYKLIKSYKENFKRIKDFLKKRGINSDDAIKEGEIYSRSLNIKDSEENSGKKLSLKMKESLYNIKNINIEEIGTSVIEAWYIFFIIGLLNSVGGLIAGNILGEKGGQLIMFCVLAPLLEETAKRIGIENKKEYAYTGLIFGLEFISYMFILIRSGVNPKKALVLRLIGLLFNFITMYIQRWFFRKGEKLDSKFVKNIGWVIGVVMHALFNNTAIKYDRRIAAWAVK